MSHPISRRLALQGALSLGAAGSPPRRLPWPSLTASSRGKRMPLTQKWDKVFPQSTQVAHQKVTFKNRYGITLAGDLYQPKNRGSQKLPALVLSGPFGAVKEQSSGLYAQQFAERGFVTLAFDPSFTGESGGEVRDVASPDIYTEDFSAAIDHIGLLPFVDRDRIGVMAICGLSGMALTAATSDSRIKAVATASMYDMSRSISRSYKDSYTREQRHKVIDYLSQQRWIDAEKGSYALGFHEVPFDEKGNSSRATACCRNSCRPMPNPVLDRVLQLLPDPAWLPPPIDQLRRPRGRPPRRWRSSPFRWRRTST